MGVTGKGYLRTGANSGKLHYLVCQIYMLDLDIFYHSGEGNYI